MSATATWTLEDLKQLEKNMAKGVLSIKYQDRLMTFMSLNEMVKLRSIMRASLGLSKASGRLLVHTEKGIC